MKMPIKFRVNWPWLGYGVLGIAIVHIIATFVPGYMSGNSAYARLSEGLPANTFVVLPPARPGVQVIPYQLPDSRYAICKFDARTGPIALNALLPTVGWTLSIYTDDGTSFYDAPGRAEGKTDVRLLLVPPGGHFLGSNTLGGNTGAQGEAANSLQIALPSMTGIVVIRAPLGGIAYAHGTERAIKKASCDLRPFSAMAG